MSHSFLRPKDIIIEAELDFDFPCHPGGPVKLHFDEDKKDFYFQCDQGRHYLSGQEEEDSEGTYYVGVYKRETECPSHSPDDDYDAGYEHGHDVGHRDGYNRGLKEGLAWGTEE